VRKADLKAKIGLLIGEDAEGKGLEYIEELIGHYAPFSLHLPVQISTCQSRFLKGLA